MSDDLYLGCAEQLSVSPGLVQRLLQDHQPDGAGWCRAHERRPERHPCSIRRLAELAAGYAAERSRPAAARLVRQTASQHSTIGASQRGQGSAQPAVPPSISPASISSASSSQPGHVHQPVVSSVPMPRG